MKTAIPIFKSWIPDWMVKIVLFSMTLPGIVIFFLPLANINAAAGYYGSEPADMQFAVALFYAGYVGFYSLERRFFTFLAAKEYFIIFTTLQMLACLVCYITKDVYILFPVRFIQGMLFASNVNISLSLMFTRLKSERAREIGFSVFFGTLLCALPFNNLVTAELIDSYNFNIVYKSAIFSFFPGLLFIITGMNSSRLHVKFPLYKLDWQSFVMYSAILSLLGYITIFGQEYYWLDDVRISGSVLAIIILLIISIFRQKSLKRPYINLRIFSYRNCKVGLVVLFVMYICRFASGITNSYFTGVLKFDPFYLSYMNVFNILGIIAGVIISAAMILQKKRIRNIWLLGFCLLFVFHVRMYYLFDIQADEFNYFLPLFLQGMGVGFIMVPTIVYIIASVPVSLGPSAAAAALAIRYFGYAVSIAIINYFELFRKSMHYNAFQDHLTKIDPMVKNFLHKQNTKLSTKGMLEGISSKASEKLLIKNLTMQTQIRFAMDYYEMMAIFLLIIMVLIAIFPYVNRTRVYLRSRRLSPA